MKKLRNKRYQKLKAGDLKKALRKVPVEFAYLGDVFVNMKFDSVIKEKLFNTSLVEMIGYDHEYSTYVERRDE